MISISGEAWDLAREVESDPNASRRERALAAQNVALMAEIEVRTDMTAGEEEIRGALPEVQRRLSAHQLELDPDADPDDPDGGAP